MDSAAVLSNGAGLRLLGTGICSPLRTPRPAIPLLAGRSLGQIMNFKPRAVLPCLEFICPKEASARPWKASVGDPVKASQFMGWSILPALLRWAGQGSNLRPWD